MIFLPEVGRCTVQTRMHDRLETTMGDSRVCVLQSHAKVPAFHLTACHCRSNPPYRTFPGDERSLFFNFPRLNSARIYKFKLRSSPTLRYPIIGANLGSPYGPWTCPETICPKLKAIMVSISPTLYSICARKSSVWASWSAERDCEKTIIINFKNNL